MAVVALAMRTERATAAAGVKDLLRPGAAARGDLWITLKWLSIAKLTGSGLPPWPDPGTGYRIAFRRNTGEFNQQEGGDEADEIV